jgi:hypothetical protein
LSCWKKTLSPVTGCVGNATSEIFWGHILQLWLQKNVDSFLDFQIFNVNLRKSAQNMENFTRVSKPEN